MNDNEFSVRINQLIDELGHNKKSFAQAIDVSQPVITHLCNGRNNPSLEILQKIIISYPSINPEWLITGNGDTFKKDSNMKALEKKMIVLDDIDKLIVAGNQSLHKAIQLIRDLKSTPQSF